MREWLTNPLTYVLALAVGTALVKGLFWLRDVHNAKQGWGAIVDEIRKDIKDILLRLPPTPASVTSGSPLRLTDFGRKMAVNMDAQAWATDLAPTLREDLAGKRAFEVDEFSRKYVHEHMQHAERVSKCMYQIDVDRDGALRVLQVVLRDALIDALGIAPDDPS